MRARLIASSITIGLLVGSPVVAQDAPSPMPPESAMKLSEILAKVEARDQFRYVSEIDWDEEAYYDIVYFTSDKAKVEIKIDPATGQTR